MGSARTGHKHARRELACAAAIALTGHVFVASLVVAVGDGRSSPVAIAGAVGEPRAMRVRSLSVPVREPGAGNHTVNSATATAVRSPMKRSIDDSAPDALIERAARRDSRRSVASRALAAEHPGPAIEAPKYFPTSELQIQPLPRSEPDSTRLLGIKASGLPIRLRLYVDAAGAVADIDVLSASELDTEAVDRAKAMFHATAFVPGKRNGEEVASYMDIELDLASLM